MLATDFKTFLFVAGEVLQVVTFGAGDSEFPRDVDHLLADFFLFGDELRDRLGLCSGTETKNSSKEANQTEKR